MKPTLRLILSIFCLSLVFGLNAQSNIASATSATTFFLRKIFRSAIIASILLIFSTSTLLSQTVTLTSIADNDIFLGSPTRNYGQSPYMYIIQGSSVMDRGLVKFDLSGIPSNAIITSATLTLVKIGIDINAMNIATHQITSPWTEGTGGIKGKLDVSNWIQRVAGTNWTTAGGDYNLTAETTTSVSNNGSYTWSIPAMVQNWVTTPSINHGVLLKSTTEAGSTIQHVFATREYTPAADQPKLVVTYTTTPIITTGTISPTTYCSGSSVNVPFTIIGTFSEGNVFTAQLSDASGNFAAPVSIGTLNSTSAGTISATIPLATPTGSAYRIRVVSSNPVVNGANNGSNITVNPPTPASPDTVTGTATQCAALTGQVYSIAAVTNATTYTWLVPTGWSITSGNGTTSITVTTGATGQNGNISVTAGNSCGTSTASNLAVTVSPASLATPVAITGTTVQCPSLKEQTYSISAVPNATTYTWTVPAGWIINSGAGTTSITVTTGTSGGNISVTAENSCGTSAPSALAVSVNPSSIDFDGIDDYIDFGNVHNQTGVFSFEAWVLQETPTTTATIISKGDVKPGAGNQRGYHLVLNNGKLNLTWYDNAGATILNIESVSAITNNKWHHIAAVYNGTDAILYVDGTEVKRGNPSVAPVTGTESFLIGAMYDSSSPTNPKNYFNGFIDEVRVWNVALTAQQIHEMMNQEIQMSGTAVKGKIMPKDISGGCLWANLKGYYPMNDGSATDLSSNGINGVPQNICLSQSQTAPMPYVSSASGGDWTNEASWLYGNVWDIENIATNNDWNIIKLSSNVTASHNVKTSSLIIDSGVTFTLQNESLLENTRYLELNGNIDLKDDSQLVQTTTSDLVTSATGKILRRQEGTSSAFRYNYWASPVGVIGATSLIDNNAATNNPNNSPFKLNMLKDESGINMQFTSAYNQVNKISTYWLYTFKNGVTYWDWALLSPTASLTPGIGYTQKGTGNAGLTQQYIFEGKPNNGTILVNVNDVGGPGSVTSVSKTEFLFGNPYPSALDVEKFIDDNEGVIGGTLQLWQQWAGDSHFLDDYKGGYAQVNKLGGVRASQFVGISGATTNGSEGTLVPSKYLPVGQGFVAEVVANGTVKFKNSQRVFIKESDANGTYNSGSVFFKSSNTKSKSTASTTDASQTSATQKIRLEFNTVVGPKTRREVLLGFSDYTTDGYDYGYDAPCSETNNNDFNLSLNGENMNMQAYSSITSDKVIPLNFKSSGNNTFEIKATEFENLDSSQEVYLRDNVTGTYFDLRQNAAYKFTSAQGKFNTRFEMVFQSESKLLGIEETKVDNNFIFYQSTTKTLFGKKLNTAIDKLAIINMNGQTVQEFSNVSQGALTNGLKLNIVASGAYVAWFQTETGQIITKKIIVN